MIKEYEVSNFKSVSHASLTLTGVNVLLGLNSAGKSSLLQPLLLLRQSAVVGSFQDRRVSLNGPLISLGTGRDVLSEFASDELTVVKWNEHTVHIPYAPTESDLAIQTSNGIQGNEPPLGNFTYLSTARIPPQVLYRRHHKYESASPMVGVQGEEAPGYLAAHGNSNLLGLRSQRNQGATGTLLEQVTAWMRRISPEASLNLNELHQLDGLELQFDFDGQGAVRTRPYRASNVGFGLSHALGIVLALVASETGTLLALEGPEAHLHPRAQRFLGHLIGQAAGDGVQIIVETHSRDLVQGILAAVASGWLPRSEFTVHYCIRQSAETKVAQIQSGHDGGLKHVGGYDDVPRQYYTEFN